MRNKIKTFNEHLDVNYNSQINESGEFGVVNIKIDGSGFIKDQISKDIKQILSKYQGERHLFIDGVEVNPYKSRGGGMG